MLENVSVALMLVAVVILCGSPEFVQTFMFTAEDMDMTNPSEYAYILTVFNKLDALSRPWGGKTSRLNPRSAFKPLLQVYNTVLPKFRLNISIC